jgi:hypothetical protein
MYEETKKAVRRAFVVGKLLFPLGVHKFNQLCKSVDNIQSPTNDELSLHISAGMTPHEAVAHEMKKRYSDAAIAAGFEGKYGIALLEYSILLQESKDG